MSDGHRKATRKGFAVPLVTPRVGWSGTATWISARKTAHVAWGKRTVRSLRTLPSLGRHGLGSGRATVKVLELIGMVGIYLTDLA